MHTLKLGLLLAACLLFAAPASAVHLGGSEVVIPVIGRLPGTGGTQWRTDVFLANPSTATQTVTLQFYPAGGAMQQRTMTIGPFSTMTFPDVVLNTFGMANAGGMLEVSVAEGFTIHARASIYNTGNPAGVFGQAVPGLARHLLSRQAYLYGLSGISGSRVNIGAANPNDVPVTVTIHVADAANVPLHTRNVTIAPHAYVQFSDIFGAFGIPPQAGVTVNLYTNELPIYGYSSEVRNDTGDAVFTFGTSPNA